MKRISYENFKELLLRYPDFNKRTYEVLVKEFGANVVNNYFEKLVNEDDEKYSKYVMFYLSCDMDEEMAVSNFCGTFGDVICPISKYDILTSDEEKRCAESVCLGNKKLTIVEKKIIKSMQIDFNDVLYPMLNLGKIFISIKDKESLDLLNDVRKLPFLLEDSNVLNGQEETIKKFIKLCNNGIISEEEIKSNFPSLNYSSKLSKEEIDYQLKLFKDYIVSKNKLYNGNMRLVNSIARNFCRTRNMSLEDKMQEGCLGLIRAINKFDCTRDIRFATYATSWIKEKIMKHVAGNNDIIKKPLHTYKETVDYRNFVEDYKFQNGIYPCDEEIMDALNYDKRKLDRIRRALNTTMSLNTFFSTAEDTDVESTFERYVTDLSEPFEDRIYKKMLYTELMKMLEENLDEQEMDIFLNRNGLNEEGICYSLAEVGKKYNITRQRVSQKEKAISKHINKCLVAKRYL